MPRVVDRDARREEILTVYLGLVSREGIGKATTRALARELGMATGALWSYFESIDELRVEAFVRTFDYASRPLEESRSGGARGLEGLSCALEAVLPLREESTMEARMSMEFLEVPDSREAVYRVQLRMEQVWRDDFERYLNEARDDGAVVGEADPRELAELLVCLVVGLQMEFAMGSPRGVAQRLWSLVTYTLAPWLAAGVVLPLPEALSTAAGR